MSARLQEFSAICDTTGNSKGLKALYDIPADQATLVESVVLFSDGKANFGITNNDSLSKATRSLLDQIGRQACVFTIGYGTEHDPDMLHGIANAGGGLFYYIENKDNIPDSFCDCLGGLLSVAAQNVRVTFTPPDNSVRVTAPLTTFTTKQIGNSYQVAIPDIYHDEEKSVPVEVFLSSANAEKNVCAMNCTLEYFDVIQCKSVKEECSIRIELADVGVVKPVESPFIGDIRAHILRCEIVKSLVRATELADQGHISEARELLNRCKHMILGTGRRSLLMQHLLDSIEESLSGLTDAVVYKRHGKPMMMQYLHSHGQQRSSSNPSKHGFDSQHGIVSGAAKPFISPVMLDEDVEERNPYLNTRKKAMKVAFAKGRK